MNFEEFFKSKDFRKLSKIFIALVLAIVVFAAGVFVGLEKARFSDRWGENYYHNFVGPVCKVKVLIDRNYINPHGSAGQVIKVNDDVITIKSAEGVEKNIITDDDTIIKKDNADLKVSDIQENDNIVVIGSPDQQGQINAKLIRIMPAGQ